MISKVNSDIDDSFMDKRNRGSGITSSSKDKKEAKRLHRESRNLQEVDTREIVANMQADEKKQQRIRRHMYQAMILFLCALKLFLITIS